MSRLLLVCGTWSLALQSTMHAASFESSFRTPNWSTPFSSTSRRTGNGTVVLASSSLVFRHRDRKGRTTYITKLKGSTQAGSRFRVRFGLPAPCWSSVREQSRLDTTTHKRQYQKSKRKKPARAMSGRLLRIQIDVFRGFAGRYGIAKVNPVTTAA